MKRAFAVAVLVAAVAAPVAPAHAKQSVPGDVVRSWNTQALDSVRRNGASDAQAARLYAMVHAAM